MADWAVVLELEGRDPILVDTRAKLEDAQTLAIEVAAANNATGGKVTISKPDSADQLQRYSRDRFYRQQPDKPAHGEHVIVHVPTVNHVISEEEAGWLKRAAGRRNSRSSA
jgi:hypothetical protein